MRRLTEPSTRGLHFGLPGRHKQAPPTAERILVPVNGSSADHGALELATEIIKSTSGSLFLAYIIEVPRELPLDAPVYGDLTTAETTLAEMEDFCLRRRCKVVTELLQVRQFGPAVVDEITERKADLVILGVSRERRYGEFTLGEAVPYVLEHAPCAVWIIRESIA